MKQFYGYIRVSTVKQGQHGVSLQEQKDAILRYARRSNIEITEWFEEQVTAAKQGRLVFNKMLKLLRAGKAQGVVLHKIDRGARNLRDWAAIGELNDQGIEVHLAIDGLDMNSRGGRLSADIQAVIAADYIRNLREETLKGFYGRLKQGILPIGAPLGYVDNGGGKAKTPHPIKAPLVKRVFELYATGKYNFDTLLPELEKMGLRNRNENPIHRSALTLVLNNIFYTGLIHIKSTGETFKGIHEPIISKTLYDRVQAFIKGKTHAKVQKHDFIFRRMAKCEYCKSTLFGEKQKGHHYYRCHNKECPMTCIREEVVDSSILQKLDLLTPQPLEEKYILNRIQQLQGGLEEQVTATRAGLQLKLGQIRAKLDRLTDALIDGQIDRETFTLRKNSLILNQKQTEDRLDNIEDEIRILPDKAKKILELMKCVHFQYETGILPEKRRVLQDVISNLSATREKAEFTMVSPYEQIVNMTKTTECRGAGI